MNRTYPQMEKLAQEIFDGKRRRRRQLAQLPVEEKFEILLQLQRLATDVAIAAGRKPRKPWPVKSAV
jgi:hypothetical protein